MMSESDFIREVDEELRHEQIKSMWDKFGPFVIGFALLIVLGTAADKGYEYWRHKQAAESGDAFIAALSLSEEGKKDEAMVALEKIKAEGAGGYPVLAEMRIASEKAANGDIDDAIALFKDAANNPDVQPVIQSLARIRANVLMLNQGKVDEVINELTSLMDNNGFRHSARELVMLAYLQKKDYAQAMPIAERISQDAETPPEMRQRAQVYVNYIRSQFEESGSDEAKEAPNE
ncbi:tetratricopeptide repeat protein [uncultured Cohaesibacter sp.]|uniref:tetratricopeptide repeat protein n=1 Tax=uncultured Cohaesibacter sp. TaxID=1002546 RepID=UPI0029C8AAB3|nr:tetratricopeptide repeat protein [uncultured Cohaesibacter sp.]